MDWGVFDVIWWEMCVFCFLLHGPFLFFFLLDLPCVFRGDDIQPFRLCFVFVILFSFLEISGFMQHFGVLACLDYILTFANSFLLHAYSRHARFEALSHAFTCSSHNISATSRSALGRRHGQCTWAEPHFLGDGGKARK